MRHNFLIFILSIFLITGCSSGSEDNNEKSEVKNAVLIDNTISGIAYKNDGNTGFTDEHGIFPYKGGLAEFFVGDIKVGEINSLNEDNKVFIQDILGIDRTITQNDSLIKIATLLQSIDSDKTTDEIEIDLEDFNKFKSSNNTITNILDNTFDVNTELSAKNFSVKEKEKVLEHLITTLKSHNITENSDTTSPTIKTILPLDGSINVEIDSNIVITFSEAIKKTTITKENIVLKDSNDNTIEINLKTNLNIVTIIPKSNLLNSETYRITITKEITDFIGNKLNEENNLSFETIEADTIPPELNSTNKTFQTEVRKTPLTFETVTATDNKDTNITVIQSGTVDFNTVGTYTITYSASDSSNNSVSITHTYIVNEEPDVTAPSLSSTDKTFTTTVGTPLTLETVTATDHRDGNVSVTLNGTVDFNTIGTYTIIYSASDSSNNSISITHTYIINPLPTNSETITHNSLTYEIITSPITGEKWLDRNLGASEVCSKSRNEFNSLEAYEDDQKDCFGDYYQWGRLNDGHEKKDSQTTNTINDTISNTPNKFISSNQNPFDWTSSDNTNELRLILWSKTDGNSICPIGFRVPIAQELYDETISYTGLDNENTGAIKVTNSISAFKSFLKLSIAGYRNYDEGTFSGTYYTIITTSTASGHLSSRLFIDDNNAIGNGGYRSNAYSVRCIKDTNINPTANAGDNQILSQGTEVIFDASSSSDSDGSISSYEWKEADTILSTSSSFSKSDFSVGTHTITLIVTDNQGAKDFSQITITINEITDNEAPVINSTDKTFSTTLGTPLTLETITAIDNKDGTVSVIQNGTVDFDTIGTYTITYSASDNANNTSSITHTYTVKPIPEDLVISVDDIEFNLGRLQLFNNSNKDPVRNVVLSSDETKAYITGYSSGFYVIDITNPKSPKVLSQYNPAAFYPQDLKISQDGTKAYITHRFNGLHILNISNPNSVSLLSSYNNTNTHEFDTIVLNSNETKAFIKRSSYIDIIDLSNTPTLIDTIQSDSSINDILLSADDSILYLAQLNNLKIFDISDINSISELSSSSISFLKKIELSNDEKTLFLAVGSQGLRIYNIINSSSPSEISNIHLDGYAYDIKLSQDETKAYIATQDASGIYEVDLADIENPTLTDNYAEARDSYELVLNETSSKAFVADNQNGLVIIDINNSSTPKKISSVLNDYTKDIAISKNKDKAFVVSLGGGLRIYNLTDLEAPNLISSYTEGVNAAYTSVQLSHDEKKVYIFGNNSGFRILDISDIDNPTLLGMYDTNTSTDNFTLLKDETKVFVPIYISGIDSKKGFAILDISDPKNISLINTYELNSDGNYMYSIILSEDETKAYVSAGYSGIKILDISDLENINTYSSYAYDSNSFSPKEMVLSNDENRLYIANRHHGLTILDVSSVLNPTFVTSFDTEFNNSDQSASTLKLSKDEKKVYLSDGEDGIKIIDVQDTNDLKIIGFYNTLGTAGKLVLSEDEENIFIADDRKGFKVLNITDTILKAQNFGTSAINLEFTSPDNSNITINVTSSNEDLITIGAYIESLTANEYTGNTIPIPITAIADKIGQSIITIEVNNGHYTYTKKVKLNIY